MVETDGYGGCAILPFGGGFRPDYLSENYFALYGEAVSKARALGAHMSIYDEYGFPREHGCHQRFGRDYLHE